MKWFDPAHAPLGLPVGSVRAILAFLLVIFTGAAILSTLALSVDGALPPGVAALITLTTIIVNNYFRDRHDEGMVNGPNIVTPEVTPTKAGPKGG